MIAAMAVSLAGCKSAQSHHRDADKIAAENIAQKQKEISLEQPFTIDTKDHDLRRRVMIDQGLQRSGDASLSSQDVKRIKDFPEDPTTRPSTQPTTRAARGALRFSLNDALKVAAANSRDYQARKEEIFISALDLDLARNDFRLIFSASATGALISDQSGEGTPNNGFVGGSSLTASRRFSNGANLSVNAGFDVVQLFTNGDGWSKGAGLGAVFSMPLMRGAGENVVLEPLRQAERDLAYLLLGFEQYKRQFAVDIATQYMNVLSQYDQIRNAEGAYRRAIQSTRRARRNADAGRLPEIQVDQSVQQELRARDRWIQAQANLGRRLDSFKIALGLPPDAEIELDPNELRKLNDLIQHFLSNVTTETRAETATTLPVAESAKGEIASELEAIPLPPPAQPPAGSLQADQHEAIALALRNRPDLLAVNGRVTDAQRKIIVAANALQAGLDLEGRAATGGRANTLASATRRDTGVDIGDGVYSTSLSLDLPLDRTAERNDYRFRFINFERSVRDLQASEDRIKSDVRGDLRDLQSAREQVQIQAKSVAVAQKRVDSTNLFLDAGRAQIRDVLEAQDALVQAQNGLTTALISYRVAELALQRDIGLLNVNNDGEWQEYEPALAGRERAK